MEPLCKLGKNEHFIQDRGHSTVVRVYRSLINLSVINKKMNVYMRNQAGYLGDGLKEPEKVILVERSIIVRAHFVPSIDQAINNLDKGYRRRSSFLHHRAVYSNHCDIGLDQQSPWAYHIVIN